MNTEALRKYREGLEAGDFTMTQVAELSGIPLATLSAMKDASWQSKTITRIADLDAALDQLAPGRPTRKRANA